MYPNFPTPQTGVPLEPESSFQQSAPMDFEQQDFDESEDEVVVIPIDHSFSDGDISTWPTEERFGRPDDAWYRQKLAEAWLKKTGAHEEGMCWNSCFVSSVRFSVSELCPEQ